MKILFLSHYFPPEVNAPASRTYEHCRAWVKSGHEVTVVTCAPNHPRGKVYEGYRNRLIQRETIDGIRVIRLWTYLSANEGFVKRTANFVSYMVMAILMLPRLPSCDVVITTSPQFFNGLAGYFVSKFKRAPWVLEIRDLWPESILALGAIRNRTVIRVLEWLEMFAYRKSDRIVPVTNAFERYMVAKGIDAAKIFVIKNGVDLSRYDRSGGAEAQRARLRKELGLEDKFIAAYFGTHGMAHHLETVLEAASSTKDPRILYMLVGDGAERARLQALKKEQGVENLMMLGQQPKENMPGLWAMADVAMVLLRKDDLFKTVIPSKIFECMAMEKPIILGVEGESREIIEAANAGIGIEPENAQELSAAVVKLCDNPNLVADLGKNGRAHVAQYFDRDVLARRFEDILKRLVEAEGSRGESTPQSK